MNSIRDVIRFINTFALKYTLLKAETDPIDLLGLTCIQVFEAEIYSRLPSLKELLCGGRTNYYDEHQTEKEKVQKAYDIITAGIPESKAENIKSILSKLFPKLSYILSNSSFMFGYTRQYDHNEALCSGSISCADSFDRYFSLALESTAIPRQIMDFLLFQATGDELIEGVLRINSQKKINRLLDYIVATFKQKQNGSERAERAKLLLKCLLRCWHKLDDNEESTFFATPLGWRLSWNIEALLSAISTSARFDTIQILFNDNCVDISTILVLLRDFEGQHNRFTEKESNRQEQLVSLDELFELEKTFVNRVVSEFEAAKLLNNNSAAQIIWLFEQIDGANAKHFTDKMINSDSSLAKLISASVGHGKGMGRTIYKIWTVRTDFIQKYIDVDEAYARILSYVNMEEFHSLPIGEKENIAAFLIEMEKTSESISINDNILSLAVETKLKEIEGKNKK